MYQPMEQPISEGSPTQPGPSRPTEHVNVNRACESCRMLKVRCLPDETSTTGTCRRCAKANRLCHYAAPQKRRPRKRTDTRVAELEREVRAMRSLLNKSGDQNSPEKHTDHEESGEHASDDLYDDPPTQSSGEVDPAQDSARVQEDTNTLIQHPSFSGMASHIWTSPKEGAGTSQPSDPAKQYTRSKDVVDRGVVSLETATRMFDTFVYEMSQFVPVLVIPEGQTSSDVREKKPMLWLMIITAGAGKEDGDLYSVLHEEVLHAYAARLIIKGEKSVELVQAMIVTAIWHYPPEDFKKLKFYQYIHMAACMALDLGLGGQNATGALPVHPIVQDKQDPVEAISERYNMIKQESRSREPPSSLVLECQRTLLACYLLCSSSAMALRRPNMLQFSSYMGDCMESLEKHSALLSDRQLIAWVQIQRLADEYGASFAFDDPNSKISLSDPRIQLTLKAFEKRMEEWKNSVGSDLSNAALVIHYHQNNIFFHEFSIYDSDDRSTPSLSKSGWVAAKPKPFNPSTVNALLACVESTHAIMDAFLSLDLRTLRSMPVIIFVRMTYSLVLLIKISISTSGLGLELGDVLDAESLKVDYYLKALLERVMFASESSKYRIPGKFTMIIDILGKWYGRRPRKDATGQSTLIKPLSNLDVNKEKDKSPFPQGMANMPEMIGTLSSMATPPGSDNSFNTSSERSGTTNTSYSQTQAPQPNTSSSNYQPLYGNMDLTGTSGGMNQNLMASSGDGLFSGPAWTGPMPLYQPGLTLPGNETFPMDMDLDFLNLFSAPNDSNFNWIMDDNMYGGGFNFNNPPS